MDTKGQDEVERCCVALAAGPVPVTTVRCSWRMHLVQRIIW